MSNFSTPQTIQQQPNPSTPLTFLSPDLATQFEVSRYIYAVTLGAFTWDIGTNIGGDYDLLFKQRVCFPTIVYFVSRVFTLAYIITSFVFQVGNVSDCQALQVAIGICNALAQGGSAMLFYLRIRAIWIDNRVVQGAFFILWLAVVGTAITIPAGISGAHIGPTMQCINTRVPGYTESTAIVGLINDTAILTGISYRILQYTLVDDGAKSVVKAFFTGRGLFRLSRALLQGGQQYYMIVVLGNIVLLVLINVPGTSPVRRAMMSIPVTSITNAMACIVYRKIRSGSISSDGTIGVLTATSSFRVAPASITDGSVLPTHYRRSHLGAGGQGPVVINLSRKESTTTTMGASYPSPLQVHSVKDTEGY